MLNQFEIQNWWCMGIMLKNSGGLFYCIGFAQYSKSSPISSPQYHKIILDKRCWKQSPTGVNFLFYVWCWKSSQSLWSSDTGVWKLESRLPCRLTACLQHCRSKYQRDCELTVLKTWKKISPQAPHTVVSWNQYGSPATKRMSAGDRASM